MRNLVVGILAHVDAGKTTLSEGLLFASGAIEHRGRVDKRTSFLDSYSLERERGITIFSKQAEISVGDVAITLIDTPGHVDFSCEAERALSVQDYAILVISAQDGVQSHTKTLWRLLRRERIPTFIFVNKMDLCQRTRLEIMTELRSTLSVGCADFSSEGITDEECAGADETLMAEYFDTGAISDSSLVDAIARERVFPTFFGSALKMDGVSAFLEGICKYTRSKRYPEGLFGARVYKIGRDKLGKRLTYMKITGGSLAAKDTVTVRDKNGGEYEEKIEELRIYSGDKYKQVQRVRAGMVCAVLGPARTEAHMGLGFEESTEPSLSPVLDYRMILPDGESAVEAYNRLSILTEEDPSLSLYYDERAKEIRVRLMGEIQTEVLRRIISERFGYEVSFGEGSILYKETVAEGVYGAGHFEPLRHYAEVHLFIEPMPEGTGIVTDTDCSTDLLATNWQRLIITHIEERVHRGTLTGSPLTDVKITLTAGRAHLKHTEGGDFRQATYRAVRQGLMKAGCVLLEPTFDFVIDLPTEYLGRAMTDIEQMGGTSEAPNMTETGATVVGNCPVSTIRSYATRLRAYTRGEGRISFSQGPYKPCHNAEEVIAQRGYDPMLDERNTPNSVFCKNGSGYVVPWDEADALMHVACDGGEEETILEDKAYRPTAVSYRGTAEEDKELMRIFESTYGKIKPRRTPERVENSAPSEKRERKRPTKPKKDSYVIIDGYNFIFASELLRGYAERDLSLARDMLVRIMCSYTAFYKCRSIIVFDAYKRADNEGSEEITGGVSVVYTKHAETADSYIERTTHALAEGHSVRVVTNDYDEQLIILGSGGLRVSAREFSEELSRLEDDISKLIKSIK